MEKVENKKKLAFYYNKEHIVGGSLLFYMRLASEIADRGEFIVYYINIPNADLESRYLSNNIERRDIRNYDFLELEGAYFVVPINYIFDFLTHTQGIRYGRILLFDWQPQLFDFLAAQFPTKRRNICSLLEMLNFRHAVAFMDESCRFSGNRWLANEFEPTYVLCFLLKSQTFLHVMRSGGKNESALGG